MSNLLHICPEEIPVPSASLGCEGRTPGLDTASVTPPTVGVATVPTPSRGPTAAQRSQITTWKYREVN